MLVNLSGRPIIAQLIQLTAQPAPLEYSLDSLQVGGATPLHVLAGQPVKINASGNPTTGYSWSVTSNSCGQGLQALGAPTYERDQTGLLGSGGQFAFNFAVP